MKLYPIFMLFPHAFAATLAPSEYNFEEGTTTLDKDITVYQGDNVPDHATITGNNSVIDGGGFQGFHFVGTRTNPNTVEITVTGVKEFTNFTDKTDGSSSTFEGGAVFAITYGGKLNFEGYSEENRLLFSGSNAASDTLTNKSKATITGYMKNNIAFSEGESVVGGGRGGALSLLDQKAGTELTLIDSDLIGNIAGTALNDSSLVTGGAVYLSNFTNLNIKAHGQKMC